jgi:hypothetical protein
MRLFLAAVALISITAVVRSASAVSVPTSHGHVPMVETVQQKPEPEAVSEREKREQCFVGCWNSCWGLYCADRCQCRCADARPDYCAKIIWGLRFL